MLVEDEEDLANEIKAELEGDGYLVRRLSIADAADAAAMSDAAMLILDRIHHGIDSLHTVQIIRKQGAKIPVLIISACSSADDVAEGLRAGADDYLPKPFYMVELVARVEAMLRRLGDISTTRLIVGDLEIDLLEGTAFKASAKLNLLPREFKLLEYFARRPGQLITRAMLLKDVWQYDFEVETNVVDTHISNLRKKIDEHGLPSRIANVRGLGYMLRPHAA
ncbi:response regulator transcription factor [Bradyrhizobium sp.]|uniref:response regulator transcription factor n=1 Tax=Bradyrhizobium sp. TaxID=376 RepID=UPI002619D1D5|nr:response regulator transcription factor [Bradyrhizobium sp.]